MNKFLFRPVLDPNATDNGQDGEKTIRDFDFNEQSISEGGQCMEDALRMVRRALSIKYLKKSNYGGSNMEIKNTGRSEQQVVFAQSAIGVLEYNIKGDLLTIIVLRACRRFAVQKAKTAMLSG